MPPTYATTNDAKPWAECVGGLILNFGALEFQTLYWIQKLLGDKELLKARKKTLSERIQLAKKGFSESVATEAEKTRAEVLWDEIKAYTKLRNRIAHNPMCAAIDESNDEMIWSVIELRKLEPAGVNAQKRLDLKEIEKVAIRVGDINRELNEILGYAAPT